MFFSRVHVRQSRTVGSSAAYKLANMKFHDFPGPSPKFHDFPGLESKLSNSMTFQVLQDRYEPCNRILIKTSKKQISDLSSVKAYPAINETSKNV